MTAGTMDSQGEELLKIAKLIIDNGHEVEEWSVTINEKMPQQQAYDVIDILEENSVSKIEKKDTLTKYSFTSEYISYQITIPHNKIQFASVNAVISGTSWDHLIKENYQKQLKKALSLYFTKKSSIYTCVTTNKNAIIKSSDFIEKITRKLKLTSYSTQTDIIENVTHKEIIYGYTTIWANKEIVIDAPLNVQIVLERFEDGEAKVIIGTPILVNEY